MNLALIAAATIVLDWLFGEPRRFHPLVGFGRLASAGERWLYGGADIDRRARRMRGVLAVALLLTPLVVAATILSTLPYVGAPFSMLMLYLALGHKSLHDHALAVVEALRCGNEASARRHVSLIVSRDSAKLHIESAATESVLENGNDGVFGALFWFAVAGAPGAVLYRLANTLDAMWGYRNERYLHFGWAAARLDDLLNFIPARLTALTYAVLGKTVSGKTVCGQPVFGQTVFRQTRQALACWRIQAPVWDSPNAGPVMAAGAGALGVTLGGPARYNGEWHERPILGRGDAPSLHDIERALQLVRHGVFLWLFAFLLIGTGGFARV
jgi:adenosylcobinamide-phosphate synthase